MKPEFFQIHFSTPHTETWCRLWNSQPSTACLAPRLPVALKPQYIFLARFLVVFFRKEQRRSVHDGGDGSGSVGGPALPVFLTRYHYENPMKCRKRIVQGFAEAGCRKIRILIFFGLIIRRGGPPKWKEKKKEYDLTSNPGNVKVACAIS